MHEICELFLHTAATFNTEVGPSLRSPVRPSVRPPVSLTCVCVRGSAGQDLREEESAVHLPGNLGEGLPNHPPLQHLPEDDRGGGRPLWETDVI